VLRGIVQGEFGVVEIVELAEARDYGGDQIFIFGAALEMFFISEMEWARRIRARCADM
jgi:hypothetical protein